MGVVYQVTWICGKVDCIFANPRHQKMVDIWGESDALSEVEFNNASGDASLFSLNVNTEIKK